MKARDVITGIQFLNDQYGGSFRLSESEADAILSALAAAGYKILATDIIRTALDLDGTKHARINLEGALDDLKRGRNDAVCHRTIARVAGQIADVECALDASNPTEKQTP